MTRFLLWLTLALVVGIGLSAYLREDSGYVLITAGPWVFETSVLGFAAGLAALWVAVVLLVRLLSGVLTFPGAVRGAWTGRKDRRARAAFDRGVQLSLEQRWEPAEQALLRFAAEQPSPMLSYLLAARAAQAAGAPGRSREHLAWAVAADDNAAFAAALHRADLMLARGELAGAIRELQALHRQDPAHRPVLRKLLDAALRSHAWELLRRLLTEKGARALPPTVVRRLLRRSLAERIRQSVEAGRLDALKSLWSQAPGELRTEPELQQAYVRALAHLGAEDEAAAQVSRVLKSQWDEVLVEWYGTFGGVDPVTQLASVESWLSQWGERPALLLTAGRVCRRNQLWGKAQSYLESVQRDTPSAQACLELARLCEETQRPEEAQAHYKAGLVLAAGRAAPAAADHGE